MGSLINKPPCHSQDLPEAVGVVPKVQEKLYAMELEQIAASRVIRCVSRKASETCADVLQRHTQSVREGCRRQCILHIVLGASSVACGDGIDLDHGSSLVALAEHQ
jgi:hypothetical protein